MTETASSRTVECPGCGLVREVDLFRRTAGEFCSRCDYPLFFVPVPERHRVGSEDLSQVEDALRRLPGDRHRLVTTACPSCDERNPTTGVTCLRCGALLHPPEPVPVPTAPVRPEPPAPPPEARPWLTPAVVAALVVAVLLLGLVLVAVDWF